MVKPVVPIERTRAAWCCASSFSADKEGVYIGHAEAQEFDQIHDRDVLEYGCGGGSDAISFLRRGNRVTYADVTHFNVDVARARIADRGFAGQSTPVKLEDSAPLPLPDAWFDVVSSHGVLHHIVDPAPVVSEFFRVLRPGGLIFVMLYTEHLRARLDRRVTELVTWRGMTEEEAFCALTDEPGCPYAIPYSEEQGRALLEGAGFVVDKATLYNDRDFRTLKGHKP